MRMGGFQIFKTEGNRTHFVSKAKNMISSELFFSRVHFAISCSNSSIK
jgi:hypothetical protein